MVEVPKTNLEKTLTLKLEHVRVKIYNLISGLMVEAKIHEGSRYTGKYATYYSDLITKWNLELEKELEQVEYEEVS